MTIVAVFYLCVYAHFLAGDRLHVRFWSLLCVVDVISRRLRLAFLNTNATVDALPRIISLLAAENKWDASKRALEYREAKKFVSTMNVQHRGRHEWYVVEP